MKTYIVNESSSNIRTLARQALNGHWKSAVGAMLIFTLCVAAPALIIIALFGGFSEEALMSDDVFMPGEGLSTVYSILVTGAFTFGAAAYFLDLVRDKKSDIGQIFSGFGIYIKTLSLYIVMSIFIMLWTILLIVPGIIATLRYSQAFYILADDPSKGVMQCLKESKEMMKGNKAKLFCLELSFVGWCLLIYAVILVSSSIGVSMSIFMPGDVSFGVSMVILALGVVIACIGVVILMPYIMSATTIFYEMANGNMRPESDELPPLSQETFENIVLSTPETVENEPLSKIESENPDVDDN